MNSVIVCLFCIFLCDCFTYCSITDRDRRTRSISSSTVKTRRKIPTGSDSNIMIALERIDMKVDVLSEKLDTINQEVKNQKLGMQFIKNSFDGCSNLLSAAKEEVSILVKTSESFGQKQLKAQQSINDGLIAQSVKLAEIKNLTVVGFTKTLEKVEKLNANSNDQEMLSNIYKGVQKLATVYTNQAKKLKEIQDTLLQVTNSIGQSRGRNDDDLEKLWRNISVTFNEQGKPFSSAAASHINRAVKIVNAVVSEVNKLNSLEPKLIHVSRLSEEMRKGIDDTVLSPIANNLSISLKSMEVSTPPVISALSKNANNLEIILLGLKGMSKYNDCYIDISSEILDHHNEIIKYFNDKTFANQPIERSMEDEKWKEIMQRLENVQNVSSDDIHSRLTKLRDDIGEVRKLVEIHLDTSSEPNEDLVFG